MGKFTDYRKKPPTKAGWYVWRMNHRTLTYITIIFLAKLRKRGAGYYESVLSPEFDHWDGYKVLLPQGKIEWADYDGDEPKPNEEVMEIVGVENTPCPFCKEIPRWGYSGRFIASGPTQTDYWHLKCCQWAGVVRKENPVTLADDRNMLLRK